MDYIFDAKNKKLGRLASEVAVILQGKKNPDYEPRMAGTDRVIVKNIAAIEVSGQKERQKIYYHQPAGYIGHLKARTYREVFQKSPKKVLQLAVLRMLPKNKLQAKRMKRLIIE
ncbi:50S ribosomal protein L13 [Candidatus Jorgensenbacteria bacterium RIFCSPLOWO2_12_FULL_42_11]|uniref:Large ribosomal subunit protein uL13 n=1 Tax=Candidatus Jorgensenbacteria bacterium RIFCSPLOWO2_12_FULL_42_11 TaxID=1798473 RepID=A0A1F6C4H9_9BACT|nr:MAG: 50S ribosomal protein L13 [Candidatus Jorgensenbacteria bacterium RIFCSPLOWO2_12_FULL_42_11]